MPSTSALVLLWAAISIGRAELGLLLILAFSGGMALALSGVGLALVYAGRAVERVGMADDHARPGAGAVVGLGDNTLEFQQPRKNPG